MNFDPARTHVSPDTYKGQDSTPLSFEPSPRLKSPLVIRAIGFDIDGTTHDTYLKLLAIDTAAKYIEEKRGPGAADRFVSKYLGAESGVPVQHVLHSPRITNEAFQNFAADHDMRIDPKVVDKMRDYQTQAFVLKEFVLPVLKAAKEAGAVSFGYTNSGEFDTLRRLAIGGVGTAHVDALYTKESQDYKPLVWLGRKDLAEAIANANLKLKPKTDPVEGMHALAPLVVPYTFKKPDDTPLREVSRLSGVEPREMMFVGEGTKDFFVAQSAGAVFAFQEEGAKAICDRQKSMNERLRPGAEPLGFEHTNNKLKELGVERDIVRLSHGWETLYRMVESGQIVFKPAPAPISVYAGKLAPATCPMGVTEAVALHAEAVRPVRSVPVLNGSMPAGGASSFVMAAAAAPRPPGS